MSWDVVILGGRHDESSGQQPPPLGEADEVRKKISASLPAIDWSDPAWGVLKDKKWSMEFNFNKTGVVEDFMLHVRGGGNPLKAISKLCSDNTWVALDLSTGEYLAVDAPSDRGWMDFQVFRGQVVREVGGKSAGQSLVRWVVAALILAIAAYAASRFL